MGQDAPMHYNSNQKKNMGSRRNVGSICSYTTDPTFHIVLHPVTHLAIVRTTKFLHRARCIKEIPVKSTVAVSNSI